MNDQPFVDISQHEFYQLITNEGTQDLLESLHFSEQESIQNFLTENSENFSTTILDVREPLEIENCSLDDVIDIEPCYQQQELSVHDLINLRTAAQIKKRTELEEN